MFKNYIKIALNSLRKNVLYTGVTLFGISFTLMVLIFAVAVLENELGNNKPMSDSDKLLFIPSMTAVGFERQTETEYDSTVVDGILKIDTITTTKINRANIVNESNSALSYAVFNEKIKPMTSPKLKSVYFPGVSINVYPANTKLELEANLVDAEFWKIFDFEFLEGKPFSEMTVDNRVREIVMKKAAAQAYFGKKDNYLGLEFVWGTRGNFKVVGIINKSASSNQAVRADIYMPITFANEHLLDFNFGHLGSCNAVLLAHKKTDLGKISRELDKAEKTIQSVNDFDEFSFNEKSIRDMYAWSFIGTQKQRFGNKLLQYVLTGLILFMLIPLINLINLNSTRVLERSGEIGVRKAFGAQTRDVLVQFLFENLILTLIGGAMGLILSQLLLGIFNTNEWLGETHLSINPLVAFIGLIIIVVFSFLSGILPAYRISRIAIANALKTSSL
ncbi:FtsX-like permease family protein [Zhouia spongiae]|uniref:FtsX-like permease family protein n=1 Tax=Zhouia spongiae TaxID=2202721 RepID=A0ABY3YKW4_9FLAO|nr:ABC transporter permease [Zhouia spongiae]UNY98459.1 FtsX-like permease family protein [Zhouia spongiae]